MIDFVVMETRLRFQNMEFINILIIYLLSLSLSPYFFLSALGVVCLPCVTLPKLIALILPSEEYKF
jgi:hypothetical protein